MSRLAAVHLPQLRFGEFGHLKDSSQCCLTQSDSQESVNLQSVKSRIHNMIFSRSAQHSGSVTSWRLGDINFHIFLELHPFYLIRRLKEPSQISSCRFTRLARQNFFAGKNPLAPPPTPQNIPACSLMDLIFILLSSSLFSRSVLRLMVFHKLKSISLVDQIFGISCKNMMKE